MDVIRAIKVMIDYDKEDLADAVYLSPIGTASEEAIAYAWALLYHLDENLEYMKGDVSKEELEKARVNLVNALGYNPEI